MSKAQPGTSVNRNKFLEIAGGNSRMKTVRINKYLSEAGICSRREADRRILEGRIRVNGKIAAPGVKVAPFDQVLVDGQPVCPEEEEILLLVHKPVGIVCTATDKQGSNNIVSFLHYPKRIYPIGRLDKDSSGLLLMTNQGELANEIMRAGNFHEKEYVVHVDEKIDKSFIEKMAAGVYLSELGVTTRPCRVWQTGPCSFQMVLTQGLNRQIRRMCQELERKVIKLERIRIMNLYLGDLKAGQYRPVSPEEKKELLRRLGKGRDNGTKRNDGTEDGK